MSATANPISPLRQRMLEDMRMRKLGEKTQVGYLLSTATFPDGYFPLNRHLS